MTTKLAKKDAGGALAQAGPTIGAMIAGDDGPPAISRLAMFHDTASEKVELGRFDWGDYIDILDKRSLGATIKAVVVGGFMSWSKFVEGAKKPAYTVYKREQVPAEDWKAKDGSDWPPQVTETANLVVVVDGEPWPYMLCLKRTSISVYYKVIKPIEKRYGHSVYEFSSVNDKNGAGQDYKRMTCRAVVKGLPADSALTEMVRNVKAAIGTSEFMKSAHDIAAADALDVGAEVPKESDDSEVPF